MVQTAPCPAGSAASISRAAGVHVRARDDHAAPGARSARAQPQSEGTALPSPDGGELGRQSHVPASLSITSTRASIGKPMKNGSGSGGSRDRIPRSVASCGA